MYPLYFVDRTSQASIFLFSCGNILATYTRMIKYAAAGIIYIDFTQSKSYVNAKSSQESLSNANCLLSGKFINHRFLPEMHREQSGAPLATFVTMLVSKYLLIRPRAAVRDFFPWAIKKWLSLGQAAFDAQYQTYDRKWFWYATLLGNGFALLSFDGKMTSRTRLAVLFWASFTFRYVLRFTLRFFF